jgi:hypothetical protein
MPLIYAFVARGPTVLAEHTSHSGNFATVAAEVRHVVRGKKTGRNENFEKTCENACVCFPPPSKRTTSRLFRSPAGGVLPAKYRVGFFSVYRDEKRRRARRVWLREVVGGMEELVFGASALRVGNPLALVFFLQKGGRRCFLKGYQWKGGRGVRGGGGVGACIIETTHGA